MAKHIEGAFGAIARSYTQPTAAMWLTRNGPHQFLTSGSWAWDIGVEYNDAIYLIGKPAGNTGAACWKYDETNGWVEQTAGTPINGSGATKDDCFLFFVDSRGYLYTSFNEVGVAGNIYRSTDDGVTWASVQTLATATYTWSMTEDDEGNLYAGAYSTAAPADGSEVALYKSTDGGANWTDIAANMAITTQKHIHDVYFCPHRKTLFVLTGDLSGPSVGIADSIWYSTDNGATFSDWNIGQYITITSDSKYLYFSCETGDDTGVETSLYRAENPGDARERVLDVASAAGFSLNGFVNEYGQVYFMFSTTAADEVRCWVSDDQGDNWNNVYPQNIDADGDTWAVNDKSVYQKRGRLSYYAGTVNFHYNSYKQWRVYPGEQELTINESTGGSYLFTKQSAGDWNTIPDVGVNNHMRIKLVADYSAVFSVGTTGMYINKNGFDFTASAVTGSLIIDVDFEGVGAEGGLAATAQNAGDIDWDSVTQVYAGSEALEIATTGSWAGVRNANCFTGTVSGEEVWMSGWYYRATQAFGGNTNLFNTGGFILKHRTDNLLAVIAEAGEIGELRQLSNNYPIPADEWVHIKMAVYMHATLGTIRVWQNGILVLSVDGVDTATGITHGNADWTNTGDTTTIYWDNVKSSKDFDPDKPTSPDLKGTGQLIIPDGIKT